jgi:hypothetical protein
MLRIKGQAAHGTAWEVTNALERSYRPRTPRRALGRRDRGGRRGEEPEVWTNAETRPHQQREARERLAAGETQRSVARSYVDQATISKLREAV